MYIYIDTSHYTYMSIHNVTRTTHTYTQTHLYVIITRTSNKTNPETQQRTWSTLESCWYRLHCSMAYPDLLVQAWPWMLQR